MNDNLKLYIDINEVNKKQVWGNLDNNIGDFLPGDYKDFIDKYGIGCINGYMWIVSPFCENPNLNSINISDGFSDTLSYINEETGSNYNIFDGISGLFPIAITDNGDTICWNQELDSKGFIIVFESRCVETYTYNMSFELFLIGILKGDIFDEYLPDDFISGTNIYESY